MASGPLVNNFEVPSWAGKPPPGLHLDVLKDAKALLTGKESRMIQKLMIDEKKCYFFGRNKLLCDFSIDHQSCSRVHAALVWHKHLNRPFIIDLNSTHGTYIGTIHLEGKKPQAVPIDSEIHFGASTRRYIIRERPQTMVPTMSSSGEDKGTDELEGGLMGLPETETELDNLTEFNTAHNRRITAIGDIAEPAVNPMKRKRKSIHVDFIDDEEIINPEDIDPSIGRFRNMVSTTMILKKKPRMEGPSLGPTLTESITKRLQNFPYAAEQLYSGLPDSSEATTPTTPTSPGTGAFSIAAKMGIRVPNLAPDLEPMLPQTLPTINAAPLVVSMEIESPLEPKKKKYAKEAWPGKKPTPSLLV